MDDGRSRTVRREAEATVRVGGSVGIPSVLRELGVDPAALLAETRLAPTLFDDPNNVVSYVARGRLLRLCVERTGCRHFGLLVGARGGLHSLGLVGLLAKYAPDVKTALRGIERYLFLNVRGAGVTLAVEGGAARLTYDIHVAGAEANDQVGDGALATMLNLLRTLCGAGFAPTEVRFVHRRPDDVGPYRSFFGVPLRFDSEHYGVVFSADWLERPAPAADAELEHLLREQIETLESHHPDDFPEQMRRVLRSALLTGHSGVREVAALFAMHPRTLHRRLREFGTSFQTLADEGRHEIARQMLADTALDVAAIAAALDYADASAFTRAFRRWTGTTPARWRATRRRADRAFAEASRNPRSVSR
ncbi:MAG: AraC family transcriptional regulator ligand-binding domain-containing protein [Betaproteobacteria bacterium]